LTKLFLFLFLVIYRIRNQKRIFITTINFAGPNRFVIEKLNWLKLISSIKNYRTAFLKGIPLNIYKQFVSLQTRQPVCAKMSLQKKKKKKKWVCKKFGSCQITVSKFLILKLQQNNKLFPTISLTFKTKQVKMGKYQNPKNHFVRSTVLYWRSKLDYDLRAQCFD
jgi:hypothetical protein